jgi:hypothetical protein
MQTITYIALFQSFLPLLYYWFSKKKITQDSKPIVPFIYLCFIASLYELTFTFVLKIGATVWFYVYDFLAFFTIQYFFYYVLNKKIKRIVWVSSFLFVLMFLYFVFHHTIEKHLNYIAYLGVFTTVLIIFYTIKWFKKDFMETEFVSLTQNSNLYFISGFMLYYAGTIVLYLLANSIYINHREFISHFWMINIFFNIIHKSLLLIGIWKFQKQIIE